MENCLVTKLKATVNNPNLPVLEVMQQFTLNAIAASGNSSMTDAQKWALNHFFYRIGAISDSGVWAKIESLYMPMISGQNIDTAMYDYVAEASSKLGSNIIFSGNGLVANDSTISPVVSGATRNKASNNLFLACGLYPNSSTFNSTIFQYGIQGDFRNHTIEATSSQGRWNWGSQVSVRWPLTETIGGVVSKHTDNSYQGVFFSINGISDGNNTIIDLSNPPSDPVAPYKLYLTTKNVPIGIWAYGEALSDAECVTLADAIRELIVAFPNHVNNG